MRSRCLNQCWFIINCTPENKIYWTSLKLESKHNLTISIYCGTFEKYHKVRKIWVMLTFCSSPNVLTHRDRDKMVAILQTAFAWIFLFEKLLYNVKNFASVSKIQLNCKPTMVQIMAWRRTSLIYLISPERNGCHFADDIFKYIFMNEIFCISLQISLKFVPESPINHKSALV